MNSQWFLQCFRWWAGGARHWTEADHKKHQVMGFDEGWTKVADQLAALAEAEGWPVERADGAAGQGRAYGARMRPNPGMNAHA